MTLSKTHSFPTGFQANLKLLVQGNQPVTYVFKMYHNLLAYAQSFDRNPNYKSEMKPIYGLSRHFETELLHAEQKFGDDDSEYAHLDRSIPFDLECSQNTFRNHPLEQSLGYASTAGELQRIQMFKRYRANVIEFLEPQYRRITKASMVLADFVKRGKVPGCLFDNIHHSASQFDIEELGCGLVVLENYSKSFVRDMPESLRGYIRANQRHIDRGYSFLPSQMVIKHLGNLLEGYCNGENRPYCRGADFIENFKLAVDVLDKEYLEIRERRKALFEHDTGNWGCDIDLQRGLCDEKIDWSVNEPGMGPKDSWHYPEWKEEVQRRMWVQENDSSVDSGGNLAEANDLATTPTGAQDDDDEENADGDTRDSHDLGSEDEAVDSSGADDEDEDGDHETVDERADGNGAQV